MSDIVKQLREAHAKSTQGEWESNHWQVLTVTPRGVDLVMYAATNKERRTAKRQSDTDFAAIAHNHLPAILDRLESAEARIALAAKGGEK